MLKKLRIKLTLISMSLVTAVLLLALAALLFSTYRRSVTETKSALQMALSQTVRENGFGPSQFSEESSPAEDSFPGPREDRSFDKNGLLDIGADRQGGRGGFFEPEELIPTLVIRVSEDDSMEIIRTNMATISEDSLAKIVSLIRKKDSAEGKLSDYDLRYMTRSLEDGSQLIALASSSQELSRLRSQALSSLAVGIPALVLLFFVSLGLSSLALKPVQRSMEQQKQFVADASHELKTPLTVIMTNNDILMRHQSSTVASQLQWLESTRDEGKRMRGLIENLLFLAKSDADRLPVSLSEISLSDLVEETVLTYEPVAFEQGIMIEPEVAPEISVTADAGQMKQLVMILLDNAVKYSEPGGTVRVSLKKESSILQLSVNNRGEVIAPEAIPHLFERFYRTDEARSRSGAGGYGLGLSSAQTITDLHKGKISCTSTEPDGTTFLVQLPADKRQIR